MTGNDISGKPNSLRGKRVLVYGINYWPERSGIGPYTSGLANFLAAEGSRVTVVAGLPHYPEWRIAPGYDGKALRRRELLGNVDVRRSRHYVPATQSALKRAIYEATFGLTGLTVRRIARPDIVLGVVPSLSGGVLAALASIRYRVPLALIFQDLMAQAAIQTGIPGGRALVGTMTHVERWLARRASRLIVIAPEFAPYLVAIGADRSRVVHIPNWVEAEPPRQARSILRAKLGWAADQQVALHAGNMGLKQGLGTVLEAAQLARDQEPKLRFVLVGEGSERTRLENMASSLPNVSFLAPQPRERFTDLLAAADVLLVHQRRQVSNMALPSKLTAYFVAARPILAAVASGSAAERQVMESSAGIVVKPEDPAALLDGLTYLRNHPEMARRLARAGKAYSERLTPEQVLPRYATVLTGMLPKVQPQTMWAL